MISDSYSQLTQITILKLTPTIKISQGFIILKGDVSLLFFYFLTPFILKGKRVKGKRGRITFKRDFSHSVVFD